MRITSTPLLQFHSIGLFFGVALLFGTTLSSWELVDEVNAEAVDAQHYVKLPRVQVEKLVQLFLDRNIGLQFDLNQPEAHKEVILIRVEHSANPSLIFQISTSTQTNQIKLRFRAKNRRQKLYKINAFLNDNQFHKIIVVLSSDQLIVVDNCRQIFNKSDSDIDFENKTSSKVFLTFIQSSLFSNIHVDKARINVGEQYSSDSEQSLSTSYRMREFSADVGNPIDSQCPSLETILDNPFASEFSEIAVDNSPNEDTFSNSESNSIMVENPSKIEKMPGKVPSELIGRYLFKLMERVDYLEGRMHHLNGNFQRVDSRIKKVELQQRGCQIGFGRTLSFGERQQNLSDCTECQCASSGNLHCGSIGCPQLTCAHPIRVPGKCCPECGQQCFYNGLYYENGLEFWPKQCVRCFCDNGRMECQFKQQEKCPELDCVKFDTPPNKCCPVCVGVDYCAPERNPCNEHAICESEQYAAKCTCKTGFFGNGTGSTGCYDIDECTWDEQLDGCRMGTFCINLPGSFKCDCLPGFQKLDDKNCLDVIRI